jgi:hypothetical protein
MRRLLASPFVRGVLGAAVTFVCAALGLALVHLWTDHLAFHTVLDFLNQHAAKIRALP